MANRNFATDEQLAALPLPMPSLGIAYETSADEIAKIAESSIETERSWSHNCRGNEIATHFSVATVGEILVTSGRTKPVALEYRHSENIIVEMCYAGNSRFRQGTTDLQTHSGEILGFQSGSGILCGGHHSGVSFCLDKKRLEKTARSIYGTDIYLHLIEPMVIQRTSERIGGIGAHPLFSLFKMINSLLQESQVIPAEMTLDDQIYRAYTMVAAREIHGDQLNKYLIKSRTQKAIGDIIDFIKSNLGSTITLTDLEGFSHYSARHLQNLFRDKFDCTPMQFVRRQRLSTAMEKLQTADWDDTVTSVGRDCGYRFSSNFSSDFHRQFGVAPSVVLRASRTPGHKV